MAFQLLTLSRQGVVFIACSFVRGMLSFKAPNVQWLLTEIFCFWESHSSNIAFDRWRKTYLTISRQEIPQMIR